MQARIQFIFGRVFLEKSDNPTYSLPNLPNLGRIDMNDTHLAIGCYPGGSSFKVLELSSLSAPSYQTVPGQDSPIRSEL